MTRKKTVTRRRFLGTSAAVTAAWTIVPRHVLGGPGQAPPSDTVSVGLVGCGTRGAAGIGCAGAHKMVAWCDVDTAHLKGPVDNKTYFTDFRRLLERKEIDVVAIGTPPHWHALIAIAAAEAGKDIFCEKPMTKFIAEGRAVVKAVQRNKRVFQIGTFGRLQQRKKKEAVECHQIIKHGLMKDLSGVAHRITTGLRVGQTCLAPQPIPKTLDYEMWLGPAPWKPYNKARVHYSNRFYWDYEGGDLTNMGAHPVDPFQWTFAKDDTSPVEVEPYAQWPQHPDAVSPFGWVELTYADGLKLIVQSGKWGKPYDREIRRSSIGAKDLDDQSRKKLRELPEPEPLVPFGEAVRTRKQAGGNAEVSHRVATALHLANIAIRMGRRIRYDPVQEQIVGDEEANRLVNIPMRAPWHL